MNNLRANLLILLAFIPFAINAQASDNVAHDMNAVDAYEHEYFNDQDSGLDTALELSPETADYFGWDWITSGASALLNFVDKGRNYAISLAKSGASTVQKFAKAIGQERFISAAEYMTNFLSKKGIKNIAPSVIGYIFGQLASSYFNLPPDSIFGRLLDLGTVSVANLLFNKYAKEGLTKATADKLMAGVNSILSTGEVPSDI